MNIHITKKQDFLIYPSRIIRKYKFLTKNNEHISPLEKRKLLTFCRHSKYKLQKTIILVNKLLKLNIKLKDCILFTNQIIIEYNKEIYQNKTSIQTFKKKILAECLLFVKDQKINNRLLTESLTSIIFFAILRIDYDFFINKQQNVFFTRKEFYESFKLLNDSLLVYINSSQKLFKEKFNIFVIKINKIF